MSEEQFMEICERHGTTVENARKNIRSSRDPATKSKIVIELRDTHQLTYNEISLVMKYYDKSGARQAYFYAKQLKL